MHQLEIERTKLLAELAHKTEINEQLQRQLEDTSLVGHHGVLVTYVTYNIIIVAVLIEEPKEGDYVMEVDWLIY